MKVPMSLLGILLILTLNTYSNVNANSAHPEANIRIPKITQLKSIPEALVLDGKNFFRSKTVSGVSSDLHCIYLYIR